MEELPMSNNMLPIVSMERHRINSDGRGIRTIVHSYGCNLSCKWCCNPQTIYPEGKALVGYFNAQELINALEIDNSYFILSNGGITFSGGEPLLHHEFIKEFAILAHEKNWTVAVESAMNVDKKIVEGLYPYIDEFIVDLKMMNDKKHQKYTGVSNAQILENIAYIGDKVWEEKGFTKLVSISIPIIPTINDTVTNIKQTISFLNGHYINNIQLLPYRDYSMTKYKDLGVEYPLKISYDKEKYEEKFLRLKKIAFFYCMGLPYSNL
jgi:pyruvate formate lyase activating enzyme